MNKLVTLSITAATLAGTLLPTPALAAWGSEKSRFMNDFAATFCRMVTPSIWSNQRKARRLGAQVAMEMMEMGWEPHQFEKYLKNSRNQASAFKAAFNKCPNKMDV